MPAKQHFFGEWFSEGPVQVNHHLCYASLRGPDAPFVGGKTELLAERGLHARTIQNFPFDFGSCHRFRAHSFNRELIAFFFAHVPNGADEHASTDKKLPLGSLQTRSLPPKVGPIRSLPVPSHER
jgi:hypothetical protein